MITENKPVIDFSKWNPCPMPAPAQQGERRESWADLLEKYRIDLIF